MARNVLILQQQKAESQFQIFRILETKVLEAITQERSLVRNFLSCLAHSLILKMCCLYNCTTLHTHWFSKCVAFTIVLHCILTDSQNCKALHCFTLPCTLTAPILKVYNCTTLHCWTLRFSCYLPDLKWRIIKHKEFNLPELIMYCTSVCALSESSRCVDLSLRSQSFAIG